MRVMRRVRGSSTAGLRNTKGAARTAPGLPKRTHNTKARRTQPAMGIRAFLMRAALTLCVAERLLAGDVQTEILRICTANGYTPPTPLIQVGFSTGGGDFLNRENQLDWLLLAGMCKRKSS